MKRVGFIPIPKGRQRGFDHADVRTATNRLYVAHTGDDRIDVIDCATDTWLRSIPELTGVAGVLIDNQHDLLFSSDRGAARISVFGCTAEELLGRVEVGAHPNGLAYDPTRRRLFVFNLGEPVGHGCSVSVVDVDALAVVAMLPLTGRPRWAVYDQATDTVYANIADSAEIIAINADILTVERSLPVPAAGPHDLAIHRGRLFCAADEGTLVALDVRTGKVEASCPLPGTPDVVMLDPDRDRLYVAVGDRGVVCVIDTATVQQVDQVETEKGAHTIGWNESLRTLYAFLPTSCGAAVFRDNS